MRGLRVASRIIMSNLCREEMVGENGESYWEGMEVMGWEVTGGVGVVVLAWVLLAKYLEYGVRSICELLELRYDSFSKGFVCMLFILR